MAARGLYRRHRLRDILGRAERAEPRDVGEAVEAEQPIDVVAVSEVVRASYRARIALASDLDLGFGGLLAPLGGSVLAASAAGVPHDDCGAAVVVRSVVIPLGEFILGE